MAADSIDIAVTVGTWVAVGSALIALVGIISPYLVLKATRSDRYQALEGVDSGVPGYVKDRWRLTRSIRFRAVRVPILTAPPSQRGGPRLKNGVAGPSEQPLLPISQTGWVNIARLTNHYVEDVKFGDTLVIRQREAWFPMHRFFILGVGLRGRYGHRDDRGERMTVETTARLVTEEPDQTGEELWRRSTTAGKLYGTTGTIWWRQSLNSNETRFDETYFAPHPDPISQADVADATPIDELFWLAIGCLPVRYERDIISVVYDLTYRSRRPIRSTQGADRTAADGTVSFKARSSLDARHYEWAASMAAAGVTPENVYYLDMDRGTTQHGSATRLSASDLERMAFGVLKLRVSSQGFLLPADKRISIFFDHMRPYHLQGSDGDSMDRLFSISFQIEEVSERTLRSLQENIRRRQNSRFSRERALLCSELDSELLTKLGTMGSGLRAVAVLSLVNRQFFDTIIGNLMTMNDDQVIDIQVMPGKVQFQGVEYNLQIETSGIGPIVASNPVNQAVQPAHQQAHQQAPQDIELGNLGDTTRNKVILTLLWACVRIVAVENNLDSKPLLALVSRMANIVHVSSRTIAPIIHTRIREQDNPRQPSTQGGGDHGDDGVAGGESGGAGEAHNQKVHARGKFKAKEPRVTRGHGMQVRRHVAPQADPNASSETDHVIYSGSSSPERARGGREKGVRVPRKEEVDK
ncbi:hypothetical protein PV04_10109 [Phialophora macrospora]|uniref:Uncharacterized protein n=1 Tax=Phialophora macrospora TaxID=1851006 RepID=A0A0D2DLG8_9EURO|nr:hypothetical protein PV04_10109 [Phialophora macrospora]